MVRSMTSAVSGLRAHQTKLDVIGNNIANVNTNGFKAARVVFRDSMYQTLSGATASAGAYAGTNSSQIGYGGKVGSISNIWTTGAYYPTDWGTDVMIQGSGYFIVGPDIGASQPANDFTDLYLTRVGEFDVIDGYLVDANGNYVYGLSGGNLVKIEITDPKATNIQIGSDGTVTYLDASENLTTANAKVAVASVENPNGLEAVENSYYIVGANAGDYEAVEAGTNGTGKLVNGGLEMSTVDLSKEFTDMITTQRGFQANSRIITVTDEMLQELVNLKR